MPPTTPKTSSKKMGFSELTAVEKDFEAIKELPCYCTNDTLMYQDIINNLPLIIPKPASKNKRCNEPELLDSGYTQPTVKDAITSRAAKGNAAARNRRTTKTNYA